MAETPKKRTKKVARKEAEQIELHPDAWERFETGMKKLAKDIPPKPKK